MRGETSSLATIIQTAAIRHGGLGWSKGATAAGESVGNFSKDAARPTRAARGIQRRCGIRRTTPSRPTSPLPSRTSRPAPAASVFTKGLAAAPSGTTPSPFVISAAAPADPACGSSSTRQRVRASRLSTTRSSSGRSMPPMAIGVPMAPSGCSTGSTAGNRWARDASTVSPTLAIHSRNWCARPRPYWRPASHSDPPANWPRGSCTPITGSDWVLNLSWPRAKTTSPCSRRPCPAKPSRPVCMASGVSDKSPAPSATRACRAPEWSRWNG